MNPRKLNRITFGLFVTATLFFTGSALIALFVKVNGRPPWDLVVIPLVFAVPMTVIAILMERHSTNQRLTHAEEDPGEGLRLRVERVNKAFAEAATLMADLQRDLTAQQAAREELIAQAEEQQRLLAVDQEQAENIRQILVGETKATIRAERRREMLFLGAGLLMSVPIGVLVNYIS